MVGPILFKIAIDRANESKAPTPTLEEAPVEPADEGAPPAAT
jgi:hypothetical protein